VNVFVTTSKKLKDLIQFFTNPIQGWSRRNSLYPMYLGMSCCAIEMAAAYAPRHDIERMGVLARTSPRHCDVLWVNGSVTYKFASRLRQLYDQMPAPKWVLTTGECAISGGPFFEGYAIIEGTDPVVPVDVHVPGCPPRPEAMVYGIKLLQEKIKKHESGFRKKWKPEHELEEPEEFYPRTWTYRDFRLSKGAGKNRVDPDGMIKLRGTEDRNYRGGH
jgi:NADH-quinone oxidoreductase subunit B